MADLTPKQKTEIIKSLRKSIFKDFWGAIGIISAVTGLSIFGIYMNVKGKIENILINRIEKQFEEPTINTLVQNVAKNEAKTILDKQILPEVSNFKSYIDDIKNKYETDYNTLKKEISELETRNHILSLGDQAIYKASRSALEDLFKLITEPINPNLLNTVLAEIRRINIFWFNATTISAKTLKVKMQDGTLKNESNLTTDELIKLLLEEDYSSSAKSAQLLGNRKEKHVPEALLQCIKKDQHLEVVRDAVDSFKLITGYYAADVFGAIFRASDIQASGEDREPIDIWWEKHSLEINEKLK